MADFGNLAAGGRAVRISDYKTGAVPRRPERMVLDEGRELQRVLYAAAVSQLGFADDGVLVLDQFHQSGDVSFGVLTLVIAKADTVLQHCFQVCPWHREFVGD